MITQRLIIIVAFAALVGCGQLSTFDEYSGNPYINTASTKIQSINYYRGGWYVPTEEINWSHDITVDFLSNGSAFVDSIDPENENCGQSGVVSKEQITIIVNHINALDISVQPPGSYLVDGGIETIKINYSNGTSKTIHLFAGDTATGSYIATNGDALIEELKSIPPTLASYCN